MSYSARAKNEFIRGSDVGSEWIPLEHFQCYKIYAITFSPDLELGDMSNRSLSTCHFALISEWKKLHGLQYYLLPEFGTKGNKLHYHGLIAFTSGIEYIRFKDYFQKTHIVMKEITDHLGWLKYITKQWKHLYKIFFVKFTSQENMLTDWYEFHIWYRADLSDDPQ